MISKKELKAIGKNLNKIIVVYDFETTGVNSNTTRPVSLAAIKVYPNGEFGVLNHLINPEEKISDGAKAVHGISDEMVKDCPKFKEIAKEVNEFFKDAEIVSGYNFIKFDKPIIIRMMEESGFKNFLKDKIEFDVYVQYCQDHRRKLADCCQYYLGEEIKDAHNALGDVETTLRCVGKIMEKHEKPAHEIKIEQKSSPIEKHIRFESGSPVINFGKHKDTPLAKMDKGYLQWMMKSDFSQDVKDIIKAVLNDTKRSPVKVS